MNLYISVSVGEVFDKLSILHLKLWNIKDPEKMNVVHTEIKSLEKSMGTDLAESYPNDVDFIALMQANKLIWDGIEQANSWINNQVTNVFEILQRNEVYSNLNVWNNQRFAAKNRINQRFNSEVREVKSHI